MARSVYFVKLKGRRLPIGNLLLINLNGIRLITPTFGFYAYALAGEPLSSECINELIKTKKCKTFLDVGAGIGAYSILVAKLGAFAIAVEPNPLLARLIEINARLNNVMIEVYRCHVADYYDSNVRLLDSLGIQADAIKIDVDGAELSVIRGGLGTIRKAGYVLIEIRKHTHYEAHNLMKQLGFKPIFIEPLHSTGFINKFMFKPSIMPNDYNVLYRRF